MSAIIEKIKNIVFPTDRVEFEKMMYQRKKCIGGG